MISANPLPDRADQSGGVETLVAADKRSVETNRRSGNQTVKGIDQHRQSARFAKLIEFSF